MEQFKMGIVVTVSAAFTDEDDCCGSRALVRKYLLRIGKTFSKHGTSPNDQNGSLRIILGFSIETNQRSVLLRFVLL